MRPPGAHLTLAGKLVVLAIGLVACVCAAQLWLLARTDGSSTTVRVLALGGPLMVPVAVTWLLTKFIVYRLTVPVMEAYLKVAAGDLKAELPPMTAGSDFVGLRVAFAAMGSALEASIQKLRDADVERRRLFADLAHELATPTSTLLGIAAALRQGGGNQARMLDHLEHESARLERLIADVREVAHLEDPSIAMSFEVCDVGVLATSAVERLRLGSGSACELRCEVTPAPARLDPIRIDQVLVNLLGNAARHAKGGVVAVDVRGGERDVVLRVEDSGAGVPDELLPELGRRLVRIDPSRSRDTGGHGLGLSIVRAIVARHGGQVSFARASLGGLAVEVRLPREPSAVEPS